MCVLVPYFVHQLVHFVATCLFSTSLIFMTVGAEKLYIFANGYFPDFFLNLSLFPIRSVFDSLDTGVQVLSCRFALSNKTGVCK